MSAYIKKWQDRMASIDYSKLAKITPSEKAMMDEIADLRARNVQLEEELFLTKQVVDYLRPAVVSEGQAVAAMTRDAHSGFCDDPASIWWEDDWRPITLEEGKVIEQDIKVHGFYFKQVKFLFDYAAAPAPEAPTKESK